MTPAPLAPVPASVVRMLDLRVRRRIAGLMPGDFRAMVLGAGTELAQIRPYRPGDDVRSIDWAVTARTGEPHVRLHVAERALTTWAVFDTSASMGFGTQDRTKADVAQGVLLTLGHLATRGANRLGVIAFDRGAKVLLPPTGDRRRLLAATTAPAGPPPSDPGSADGLRAALDLAGRVARRPGVVLVVTDLRGPRDWRPPLARLALRHHVLVIEIVDEREQVLVDAGVLVLEDPETGRQVRVDTRNEGLRRRFEEEAAAERADVRRIVSGTGASHVALTTSGDWLRPLAVNLSKRRRTA